MQRTPLLIALCGFALAVSLLGWQISREPAGTIPDPMSADAAEPFGNLEEPTPVEVPAIEQRESASPVASVEKQEPAAGASVRKQKKAAAAFSPAAPEPAPVPDRTENAPVSPPSAPQPVRTRDRMEEARERAGIPPADSDPAPFEPRVADSSSGRSEAPGLAMPPAPPRRIDENRATIVVPSSPRAPSTAPRLKPRVFPEGSVLEIRLAENISTDQNQKGDTFKVILESDVEANGEILLKKGSLLIGTIEESIAPGRVKGRAELAFSLTGISFDGQEYPIRTNTITMEAESTKGRDVATVGATTAIGAVLGGIFGGGKGAAIGGAAGAGAGTGGVLLGRGKDVELEKERLFSFRLEEAVEMNLP